MERVITGGSWDRGAGEDYQTGYFRVIVTAHGWEHVRHAVYVQWMINDEDKTATKLVTTEPLAELNGEDVWVTTEITFACQVSACWSDEDAGHVEIGLLNSYDYAEQRWVVAMGEPGEVRVLSRE